MSGKEKHNSIKKYLGAKEFVEYCKANNVDASLEIFEGYEKVGLLLPIYRLITPAEYVRALFEYNHKNPFDTNVPFDIDNKWQEIEELYTAINRYYLKPLLQFSFALIHGHPLDYACQRKSPFLQKPSKENFKPWEEYKIIAGTIKGHPAKEETVEHYYTAWQIFVLDELNLMYTIKENYATRRRKGWGIFKKELHPSELIGFYEYFQTISNFEMMESLIWHDITFDVKGMVIEGKLHKQFRTRTQELAKKEYKKHSYSEWIKFIRKLVELYTGYVEREKIRLADESKRFLTDTINMIIEATKKPFERISADYDGRFKGIRSTCREEDIFIYPGELERIYPDEVKQAKERAGWALESLINELNKSLPDNAKIDLMIKDRLVNNIIESGYYLLLSHLYEIEKLWFNHSPHWESSIWAHLRSFAVSIESIGQKWYGQKYLTNILENVFKKEYTDLRNSIGKKITDAEAPSEYKQKIAKILEFKKKGPMGICGCHLVVTNLTRNYFAHNVKFEPDMLGSLFIEVYQDLVFTLISLFVKKVEFDKASARDVK
jgi:hypothetical protein